MFTSGEFPDFNKVASNFLLLSLKKSLFLTLSFLKKMDQKSTLAVRTNHSSFRKRLHKDSYSFFQLQYLVKVFYINCQKS